MAQNGAPCGALWGPLGSFLDVFGRFFAPSRRDVGQKSEQSVNSLNPTISSAKTTYSVGPAGHVGGKMAPKCAKMDPEEHKSEKKAPSDVRGTHKNADQAAKRGQKWTKRDPF